MLEISAFIVFTALLWLPNPPTPPQEDEVEDYDEALRGYTKARRGHAVWQLLRIVGIFAGGIYLLVNVLGLPGFPSAVGPLLLLTGVYAILLLAIQRAENNRRVITALFMLFCAWLVSRYAGYRDYDAANQWAVYAALLLNYLFWLGIGRRFPVGSSQDIKVWGMDS